MKIVTYILSLILGSFVYFLFAAYMSVASGLNSSSPLVSVGLAILIFGFLSWFHFYKPKTGAILMTIAVVGMYLTWPIYLLIEYFSESKFTPSPIEYLTPLVLGGLVIYFVWRSRDDEMNKWLKLTLAIIPSIIGLYIGGYMAFRIFG